ncbi:MAG: hypothetical protein DRO87_11260 [Candidatus Thorarchaeota archaeon]|nr:MAG: hypothetical protein DRO87_11260 [Candidatus Thorarchaeota archaeon]
MSNKLSTKQRGLITQLLSGSSIKDSCETVGISRSGYYRWLKQDRFRSELTKRTAAMLSGASAMLTGNLSKAVAVLVALLDERNPNVKRLTACAIIDRAFKASEMVDLEARITRLEETIK